MEIKELLEQLLQKYVLLYLNPNLWGPSNDTKLKLKNALLNVKYWFEE